MTDSPSISESVIRDRARKWGAAGLVAFLLAYAFLDFERLRSETFDLYQRAAPRSVEAFPARLIEIDEKSLNEIGPWPWPRDVLADLAHGVLAQGAVAVAFDVIFPEADRYAPRAFADRHPDLPAEAAQVVAGLPDPDRRFADILGRAPIVLSRSGVPAQSEDAKAAAADLPLEAVITGSRPDGLLTFEGAVANIPELGEVAAGHASINGPPDKDGVVRRVPMIVDIAGNLTPGLSLELLRVAWGADEIELVTRGKRLVAVRIADRVVPTEADGRLRLRFSPPLAGRAISAADVLAARLDGKPFERSVAIISPAAVGLEDIVATPVAAESFGADVHAQAIENILSDSWLFRPHWAEKAEWLLGVVLALAAVLLLPLISPRHAAAIVLGSGFSVAAASYAAFAGTSYLYDPVVPMTGGGLAALLCLSGQLIEIEKARARLRDALFEERVTTAKLAGELEAARDIQLGMLPGPDELAALPDAVELRAFLEPAKAVGGDLYDAFMVDDRWLYFIVGDVTGKGVPASLFMALAKALSKSVILRHGEDLEEAVIAANQEISRENTAELFVTALIGLLDIETGDVRLCNAGHDNPLIQRADGTIEEIEMDGGPPLCVFEDFPYPQEGCRLAPGETMVILTDGVTEAKNPADELFGHARVLEVLERRPESGQATVDDLVAAVHAFEAGGEPTDDLTVMVLTYRGAG